MMNLRFTAQLLCGPPARRPEAVVERLLAVQAQDPRGARLAIRARSRGIGASTVDNALTEERTLIVTWLNRGTLHLVRSNDYPWLQALVTPRLFNSNARRLSQEGVPPSDAQRGIEAIERSLTQEGPLTRTQLAQRVEAARVRTRGQALAHILMRASLLGMIVRGPMVAGQQAYVLVRDWLGEQPPPDRHRALAELARRYLAGHAPAAAQDLAKWAGVGLRDARAGLHSIAAELNKRPDGLVELIGQNRPARTPPPLLLGPFEPVLLGWTSRDAIVGQHGDRIASGGLFRAFALVRGRAVATWALRDGRVEVEPFEYLSPGIAAALENEAAAVKQFFAS